MGGGGGQAARLFCGGGGGGGDRNVCLSCLFRGGVGLSAARSVDRRRSPAGGGRFVEGIGESRGGEVGDFRNSDQHVDGG